MVIYPVVLLLFTVTLIILILQFLLLYLVFVFPHQVENRTSDVNAELSWNFDWDFIESVDCFW